MTSFDLRNARKVGSRIVLVVLALFVAGVSLLEVLHYQSFGHLLGYGLHVDLLREPMSIGIPGVDSGYAVKLTNFSLWPASLQACRKANDVTPFWQLTYRYQVERLDSSSMQWLLVFRTSSDDCKPVGLFGPTAVMLWPGRSEMIVGWGVIAGYGLSKGSTVRFTVFGRFAEPDGAPNQLVLTSPSFVITEELTHTISD